MVSFLEIYGTKAIGNLGTSFKHFLSRVFLDELAIWKYFFVFCADVALLLEIVGAGTVRYIYYVPMSYFCVFKIYLIKLCSF